MNIRELVDKYRASGYSFRDAQNLAAEEIVLGKIATSKLAEHITLKGGIVMYNLTKSNRRVTQDIDFDLIRYSIDKESIKALFRKMNSVHDGVSIDMIGNPEDLHHEDYQGVRVRVVISDASHVSLRLKLDIGVHTYTAIEQEKLIFNTEANDGGVALKINPPEQICAEKLLSLARLGVLSTRHKDLYDLYYLIHVCGVDPCKTSEILSLFLAHSKRRPSDIIELQNSIEDTLNNDRYLAEAENPVTKWLDVDVKQLKQVILSFVDSL